MSSADWELAALVKSAANRRRMKRVAAVAGGLALIGGIGGGGIWAQKHRGLALIGGIGGGGIWAQKHPRGPKGQFRNTPNKSATPSARNGKPAGPSQAVKPEPAPKPTVTSPPKNGKPAGPSQAVKPEPAPKPTPAASAADPGVGSRPSALQQQRRLERRNRLRAAGGQRGKPAGPPQAVKPEPAGRPAGSSQKAVRDATGAVSSPPTKRQPAAAQPQPAPKADVTTPKVPTVTSRPTPASEAPAAPSGPKTRSATAKPTASKAAGQPNKEEDDSDLEPIIVDGIKYKAVLVDGFPRPDIPKPRDLRPGEAVSGKHLEERARYEREMRIRAGSAEVLAARVKQDKIANNAKAAAEKPKANRGNIGQGSAGRAKNGNRFTADKPVLTDEDIARQVAESRRTRARELDGMRASKPSAEAPGSRSSKSSRSSALARGNPKDWEFTEEVRNPNGKGWVTRVGRGVGPVLERHEVVDRSGRRLVLTRHGEDDWLLHGEEDLPVRTWTEDAEFMLNQSRNRR